MKTLVGLLLALVASTAPAQEYRLPFDGRWFVLQAGDTPNVNQHMGVRAQWFGVDFGRVGGVDERALVRSSGAGVEDFYCWGSEVRSPVAGEVVEVVDGLPDHPLGTKDLDRPAGNHVAIRATADQFVFVAHLQNGSTAVRVGQQVAQSQPIGRCGNSGNSDYPHVHLHVQDRRTLDTGTGRNIAFSRIDVELAGKAFTNVEWPLVRGLFVRNHDAGE